MKRKLKLFFSLTSVAFSLALLVFGVYAALSVTYTIGGNISYQINEVFVNINTALYKSTDTALTDSAGLTTQVTNLDGTISDANLNTWKLESVALTGDDSFSTYDSTNNQIVSPGEVFDADSTTTGQQNPSVTGVDFDFGTAPAYYIVVEIENLGSEAIYATLAVAGLSADKTNNYHFSATEYVNIAGKTTSTTTEKLIVAVALKDRTKGVETNNFTLTIQIEKGTYTAPAEAPILQHNTTDGYYYITMGTLNGADAKWRLIALDGAAYTYSATTTPTGTGTFILDTYSNAVKSEFDGASNVYSGSTIESFLSNGFLTALGITSENEIYSNIIPTDLSDVSVTGARLWLLSDTEASTLLGENLLSWGSYSFWLRSPYPDGDSGAYFVYDDGFIYDGDVLLEYGARAAFKFVI